MEFKNELERWHKMKEFAEYLTKYADYHEMKAIRKCTHYEFDSQSAEEYCWCPSTRGKYGAARSLNGESEEICWKCPNYNPQSSVGNEDVIIKAKNFDLVFSKYIENRECSGDCSDCDTTDYCPFTIIKQGEEINETGDPKSIDSNVGSSSYFGGKGE